MKRTSQDKDEGEMAEEYRFDYSKAKPNRFAGRVVSSRQVVVLEPEVAEVFRSSEAVNKALRGLLEIVPPRRTAPRQKAPAGHPLG